MINFCFFCCLHGYEPPSRARKYKSHINTGPNHRSEQNLQNLENMTDNNSNNNNSTTANNNNQTSSITPTNDIQFVSTNDNTNSNNPESNQNNLPTQHHRHTAGPSFLSKFSSLPEITHALNAYKNNNQQNYNFYFENQNSKTSNSNLQHLLMLNPNSSSNVSNSRNYSEEIQQQQNRADFKSNPQATTNNTNNNQNLRATDYPQTMNPNQFSQHYQNSNLNSVKYQDGPPIGSYIRGGSEKIIKNNKFKDNLGVHHQIRLNRRLSGPNFLTTTEATHNFSSHHTQDNMLAQQPASMHQNNSNNISQTQQNNHNNSGQNLNSFYQSNSTSNSNHYLNTMSYQTQNGQNQSSIPHSQNPNHPQMPAPNPHDTHTRDLEQPTNFYPPNSNFSHNYYVHNPQPQYHNSSSNNNNTTSNPTNSYNMQIIPTSNYNQITLQSTSNNTAANFVHQIGNIHATNREPNNLSVNDTTPTNHGNNRDFPIDENMIQMTDISRVQLETQTSKSNQQKDSEDKNQLPESTKDNPPTPSLDTSNQSKSTTQSPVNSTTDKEYFNQSNQSQISISIMDSTYNTINTTGMATKISNPHHHYKNHEKQFSNATILIHTDDDESYMNVNTTGNFSSGHRDLSLSVYPYEYGGHSHSRTISPSIVSVVCGSSNFGNMVGMNVSSKIEEFIGSGGFESF